MSDEYKMLEKKFKKIIVNFIYGILTKKIIKLLIIVGKKWNLIVFFINVKMSIIFKVLWLAKKWSTFSSTSDQWPRL